MLPPFVKKTVYKLLFCSYLSYCHLIWAMTTVINLSKIHSLKKTMRDIYNAAYDSHTEEFFRRLDLLTIYYLHNNRLISTDEKETYSHKQKNIRSYQCSKSNNPRYEARGWECRLMITNKTTYRDHMKRHTLPKLPIHLATNSIDVHSTFLIQLTKCIQSYHRRERKVCSSQVE